MAWTWRKISWQLGQVGISHLAEGLSHPTQLPRLQMEGACTCTLSKNWLLTVCFSPYNNNILKSFILDRHENNTLKNLPDIEFKIILSQALLNISEVNYRKKWNAVQWTSHTFLLFHEYTFHMPPTHAPLTNCNSRHTDGQSPCINCNCMGWTIENCYLPTHNQRRPGLSYSVSWAYLEIWLMQTRGEVDGIEWWCELSCGLKQIKGAGCILYLEQAWW